MTPPVLSLLLVGLLGGAVSAPLRPTTARPAAAPAPVATTAPAPRGRATLPPADDRRAAGMYALDVVNGRALPFGDRLIGSPGYEFVGRVRRLTVNLRPSGRFALTAQVQHAHVLVGTPLPLGDSWREVTAEGAWTVRRGELTLLPDSSRRGRPAPAFHGGWRGDRITMDLFYNGQLTAWQDRKYVVRMRRLAGVWL